LVARKPEPEQTCQTIVGTVLNHLDEECMIMYVLQISVETSSWVSLP